MSSRRSPIGGALAGASALDVALPESAPAPRAKRRTPERETIEKVRATYHLPADLVAECRSATIHLAGPPARMTLAKLVETALRNELARLRKTYNGGEPFPRYAEKLPGGRPIKP